VGDGTRSAGRRLEYLQGGLLLRKIARFTLKVIVVASGTWGGGRREDDEQKSTQDRRMGGEPLPCCERPWRLEKQRMWGSGHCQATRTSSSIPCFPMPGNGEKKGLSSLQGKRAVLAWGRETRSIKFT